MSAFAGRRSGDDMECYYFCKAAKLLLPLLLLPAATAKPQTLNPKPSFDYCGRMGGHDFETLI